MPVEEEGAEARAAEEVATAADRVRRPASALQIQIELNAVKIIFTCLLFCFKLELKNNLIINGEFFLWLPKVENTF